MESGMDQKHKPSSRVLFRGTVRPELPSLHLLTIHIIGHHPLNCRKWSLATTSAYCTFEIICNYDREGGKQFSRGRLPPVTPYLTACYSLQFQQCCPLSPHLNESSGCIRPCTALPLLTPLCAIHSTCSYVLIDACAHMLPLFFDRPEGGD